MLPWQYSQLQRLSKKARAQLEERYQYENMQARREKGILIPEEWYETYGKICKPIVVSQNRFVLDGFTALLVAKNLGLNIPLPFITLENVIVI